ncbi:hypothetical protein Tco_0356829 [Tanacetum coccineum]
MNVEESSSKSMLAIDGVGFDWSFMTEEKTPTNFALMAFSYSEVNKSVSENSSNEIKKTSGAIIIEDWISDCDEDETLEKVSESSNVQKPKQADQPRKISQNPRNNSTNWNTPMSKKLGVNSINTAKGKRGTSVVGEQGINAVKISKIDWLLSSEVNVEGSYYVKCKSSMNERICYIKSMLKESKHLGISKEVGTLRGGCKKTKYEDVETEHAEEESFEVHLDVLKRLSKATPEEEPTEDMEKALWVELKRLFKPDKDDVLWKLQRYIYCQLQLWL